MSNIWRSMKKWRSKDIETRKARRDTKFTKGRYPSRVLRPFRGFRGSTAAHNGS